MTQNNFINSSILLLKKIFKTLRKKFQGFSFRYPQIVQRIQFTCIYFFALMDLFYSILNNVFALGYMPEYIEPFFPLISALMQSPILKIMASPEKVFFLSYLVIELMIVRSTFKFSKLIKYNILLLFSLLMVQGLVISYWDLLFHRAATVAVASWAYDGGAMIGTNRLLAVIFFLNTFTYFLITYAYLYFKALKGEFATFPGLEWLTDSVAFWLRIKTPTMRFGSRKKKKGDDKRKK
jgi:hypothetical protein